MTSIRLSIEGAIGRITLARPEKKIALDRVTADELAMAKGNLTQALPGSWETANEVSAAIREMVQFNLAPDYYDTFAGKVKSMTLNDMNTAAQEVVRGNNLVWIVVGDRAKIESGVRSLNLGEVHLVDADGNPVK